MQSNDFVDRLRRLSSLAKEINKFNANPDDFLVFIKQMDPEYLNKQLEENSKCINNNEIDPIKFIRFVIVDKIIKNENINITVINQIKMNITTRNTDHFHGYSQYIGPLSNIPKGNPFQAYSTFNILFNLYYPSIENEVNAALAEFAEYLKEILNLQGENSTVQGFNHNNNLGTDMCYAALFPKSIEDHRMATQVALQVNATHSIPTLIRYGLIAGAGLKKESQLIATEDQVMDNFNADRMKMFLKNNVYNHYLASSGRTGSASPAGSDLGPEENNEILASNLNIILSGPPGTGKTYNTQRVIWNIIKKKDLFSFGPDAAFLEYRDSSISAKNRRTEYITFHESFAYEEFVEEHRTKNETGAINYNYEDGIFKRICLKAIWETVKASTKISKTEAEMKYEVDNENNYESIKYKVREIMNFSKRDREALFASAPKYFLVIDQIGQADIAKVFGELVTLLEEDKRLGAENELIVTLPYSKQKFGVPPNLYVIGTMNTADKIRAFADTALRRRFIFKEMQPDYDLLKDIEVEGVKIASLLESMNQKIVFLKDKDLQIGHSYFLELKESPKKDAVNRLKITWFYKIIPLIQEYFFNDWAKIKEILGDDFLVKIEKEGAGTAYAMKHTRDFSDNKLFIAALKKLYKDDSEIKKT
ncbi:MAG: AAA family ATPase [bacterium]|nr:AAA family ATPase [bacterium]MDD5755879.1 AAA family ATPase [bacterium]